MLFDLKTMNETTGTIEEVKLIPELTAAYADRTDPHGKAKAHHPAGRHPTSGVLRDTGECSFEV